MYVLTEEGERYLRDGLPEKRLRELLKKPTPLADLKDTADFAVGLQWAKKHGWVQIKGGKLHPVKKPGSLLEEAALKGIADGKPIPPGIAALLVKRKLIREQREDVNVQAQHQLQEGVNALTPELIKSGLWKQAEFKPYNVKVAGRTIYPGKRHPYQAFLLDARKKLVEMGFREMSGPSVELEFWNFDALYQAQNHPSRDWTQTYSLKTPPSGRLPAHSLVSRVKAAHENGWKTGSTGWGYRWDPKKAARLMPRAHGTAVSARTLANKPQIPGKYFAISRCYRPDVIDATHGVEFNQFEGIVLGEDLTFRDLLSLLKTFAREVAGTEKVKFFPDYYPFTEFSTQLSVKHPKLGWVEFGGSGIFRPELTQPLGVDVPVLAWGLGIDRLAMVKLGITDIRQLFSTDLNWLRKSRVMA